MGMKRASVDVKPGGILPCFLVMYACMISVVL